jgi:hypothetical protein
VHSRSYYMLIASLPNLPPHFDVERTPITRAGLQERLRMLHPTDAAVIDQVAAFLAWDRQPLDRTDEEVIATYDRLLKEITNTLLRDLVKSRMDIRTIVCGLRQRRAGMGPPEGVGQWVDHLRRHWNEPEFNLQGRHPWIGQMNRCLAENNPLDGQRLLFDRSYRQWSRWAERYTFSFETIILYLARWEIIDRWTSRNAATGRERFEKLITETLGDYANLF